MKGRIYHVFSGKVIEEVYDIPKLRSKFVPAARKARGIVCSVEREGRIAQGDTVQIITAHL